MFDSVLHVFDSCFYIGLLGRICGLGKGASWVEVLLSGKSAHKLFAKLLQRCS